VRRQDADHGHARAGHLSAGDGQPERVDPGAADDRAVVEHCVDPLERQDSFEPAGLFLGGLPAEVVADRAERNAHLVEIADQADAVRHDAILSAAVSAAAMARL
jgi:hypothetical protein